MISAITLAIIEANMKRISGENSTCTYFWRFSCKRGPTEERAFFGEILRMISVFVKDFQEKLQDFLEEHKKQLKSKNISRSF